MPSGPTPELIRLCATSRLHACEIAANAHSITFRPCGTVSYNPNDVANRYCPACHRFMDDVMRMERSYGLPKRDAYGEIINGYETYAAIAARLRSGESVIVGWTDEIATHYDILFTLSPQIFGMLQGIHPAAQAGGELLFVSILRKGAFGFVLEARPEPLHADYVAEKLYLGSSIAQHVADLINGVLAELHQHERLAP